MRCLPSPPLLRVGVCALAGVLSLVARMAGPRCPASSPGYGDASIRLGGAVSRRPRKSPMSGTERGYVLFSLAPVIGVIAARAAVGAVASDLSDSGAGVLSSSLEPCRLAVWPNLGHIRSTKS